MLQILLGEDSSCQENKIGEDSPVPKFIYLTIGSRDGIESSTILEEGEFKVPIDGCINCNGKMCFIFDGIVTVIREFSICTTDGFCDGKTSNVASSPQRLSGPLRVVELG